MPFANICSDLDIYRIIRIDHILFSSECWRSSGTYVDRSISYSDHYPLVTFLAPRP